MNFTQMHFFCRVIDNFIQYSTFQSGRYDAAGPSYTVVTEETVNKVEENIFQKIQIPPIEKLLKY